MATVETRGPGDFMTEEKKDPDKATDLSDYARYRPPNSPPPTPEQEFRYEEERSTGGKILRGCGIAVGIAALVFLFIVGACFISLSRW